MWVGGRTYFSEGVWSSGGRGFGFYGTGKDGRGGALGGAVDTAAICHGCED